MNDAIEQKILIEKAQILVQQKLKNICYAFTHSELELFLSQFKVDVVSEYYLKRWFSGYAFKVQQPYRCNFKIIRTNTHENKGYWYTPYFPSSK